MLFKTKRLVVREYMIEDAPYVNEYTSDPIVSKYQSWTPNTLEQTKAFISSNVKGEFNYCVTLNSYPIGGCSIYFKEDGFYIGYIINPKYWGKGYANGRLGH